MILVFYDVVMICLMMFYDFYDSLWFFIFLWLFLFFSAWKKSQKKHQKSLKKT